ncbi:MAG: hypothetical protein K0R24_54 [Gammaproteobacteria bacterium]|nr:hypothetical protein [Gammaproteobacteria bacterium]
MPQLSATERAAMAAGTVSWDGELFSGHPNATVLFHYPRATLNAEEIAFLDGPVEELCSQLNAWRIQFKEGDMPSAIWQFIKENGFLGLIIPKQYGGKEFSAYAHSRVIVKLASVSPVAAVSVCVPNSLGPAELLLHYGTTEQKEYYLPRLAQGLEIPCFALTSPVAGSDATSIIDKGIVCEEIIDGKKILGMRLTWNKRYITLAPVATLIGLAFKLYDPNHLLGDTESLGITCALIPRQTTGVIIGRRHLPNNVLFQNGPIQGQDVFLPLDSIIGGRAQIGQGWKMLVECLSVGRAISIPSLSIGTAKACVAYGGAYAAIRHQFKHSLIDFEGVQAVLANMCGLTYIADAAEELATSLIDAGEKPSVISAIVKYQVSEMTRTTVLNTMDILGGKGLCMGPANPITTYYNSSPIGITVEGASILTRSLVIFGQGLFRSHPYLFKEMQLASEKSTKAIVSQFDTTLLTHMKHVLQVACSSFWGALSKGKMLSVDSHYPVLKKPLRALSRYSAAFALLVDSLVIVYGGSLKRKEFISARMADILNYLFCVSAVIKKFQADGLPEEELPLLTWCCQTLFYQVEESMMALLSNLPWYLRIKLRCIIFPLGREALIPSDKLEKELAQAAAQPSTIRSRLTHGAYIGASDKHPVARISALLPLFVDTDTLWKKLLHYNKSLEDPRLRWSDRIHAAVDANVLTPAEGQLLLQREIYRQEIIAVSDYSQEELDKLLFQKEAVQG